MSLIVMDSVGEVGAFCCAGSCICYSTLKSDVMLIDSWRMGSLPNLLSKIEVGIVTKLWIGASCACEVTTKWQVPYRVAALPHSLIAARRTHLPMLCMPLLVVVCGAVVVCNYDVWKQQALFVHMNRHAWGKPRKQNNRAQINRLKVSR